MKNLAIENARIIFRNFRGEASTFNAAGNRNFCLLIPKEQAYQLQEDGWKVKWPRVNDQDDDSRDPYIPVTVRFFGQGTERDGRDPKIFVRNSVNDPFVEYTEKMVSNLDNAEIENLDVVIRPREWEMNGKSGVKAYLKSMWVTLLQDEFYGKYYSTEPAEYEAPSEDEGVPFN